MMPPLWEKVISTLLNTDLRYVRVNSTDLLNKEKISQNLFFNSLNHLEPEYSIAWFIQGII